MIEYVESPCKDCKERHESCHSFCDKYKKYSSYRESVRKNKQIISSAMFVPNFKSYSRRKHK